MVTDKDPLDPISTQQNLRRPGLAAPGKRSPCNCNIHCQISLASSWLYVLYGVLRHFQQPESYWDRSVKPRLEVIYGG